MPIIWRYFILFNANLIASDATMALTVALGAILMNAVFKSLKVRVRWKLREVMARRRVKNDALAQEMRVHKTTVSRWKAEDALPPVGNAEIVAICHAITKLTHDSALGPCTLSELVGLEEDS